MAEIRNLPQIPAEELRQQISDGGKFVQYDWVLSIIILTFMNRSAVYYVPPGDNRVIYGVGHIMFSCWFGWWGFPWGPIRVIQSLINNFGGGHDVTEDVLQQHPEWNPYAAPTSPNYPPAAADAALAGVPGFAATPTPNAPGPRPHGGPAGPPASQPVTGLGITSLILGILSLVPCFCLSWPLGITGIVLGGIGFLQTMGAAPRRKGRGIAIAGVVLCLIGMLIPMITAFTFGGDDDGPKTPDRIVFDQADDAIRRHEGKVAFGNCDDAVALAQRYSDAMAIITREAFTGYKDSELSMSDNKFLVYCHLTDDRVVFMVHVPELRRYKGEVLDDLRTIAWHTARNVTDGETDMNLVVALRGALLYDSTLTGRMSLEEPSIDTFAAQDDVAEYVTTEQPTRSFSFTAIESAEPEPAPALPAPVPAPSTDTDAATVDTTAL